MKASGPSGFGIEVKGPALQGVRVEVLAVLGLGFWALGFGIWVLGLEFWV